jgi:hypothetical protein
MKPTYEILDIPNSGQIIVRTDASGQVWNIPIDPGNSDYQRYLNPEAAQSTPIVTEDE